MRPSRRGNPPRFTALVGGDDRLREAPSEAVTFALPLERYAGSNWGRAIWTARSESYARLEATGVVGVL